MESLIGKNIDFSEAESEIYSRKPLPPPPNELPKNMITRENLGFDLTRSATVEALISQNEDLMNRLKVALKRLAILESDNQNLSEESNRLKLTFSSLRSQSDVYKEDSQRWRTQLKEKETEVLRLTEIAHALDLKNQKQTADLQRFEKFQEKIRSQVKPFLSELKIQNKNLKDCVQSLDSQVTQKEAQITQLRDQLLSLNLASKNQIQVLERQVFETTQAYENQVEQFAKEARHRQDQVTDLEEQILRLSKRAERMDTVENELVAQHRIYEEVTQKYKFEVERLQSENSTSFKSLKEAELLLERLKSESQTWMNRFQEQESRNKTLNDQLDQMRLMWNEKCDEIEKNKKSMNALERLNIELSTQLQRDRQRPQE